MVRNPIEFGEQFGALFLQCLDLHVLCFNHFGLRLDFFAEGFRFRGVARGSECSGAGSGGPEGGVVGLANDVGLGLGLNTIICRPFMELCPVGGPVGAHQSFFIRRAFFCSYAIDYLRSYGIIWS
jgi:hypothetical protein